MAGVSLGDDGFCVRVGMVETNKILGQVEGFASPAIPVDGLRFESAH